MLAQKVNFRLPGTALSAWLPEELGRAAPLQGGVPGEALSLSWRGQRCQGEMPKEPGEGLCQAHQGLGH